MQAVVSGNMKVAQYKKMRKILTVEKTIKRRTKKVSVLKSFKKVAKAKELLYPRNITASSNSAEVPLQDLLGKFLLLGSN